jgi:hypothetical protein
MTPREAIRILMLSPLYFRLDLEARKILVQEFCSKIAFCFGLGRVGQHSCPLESRGKLRTRQPHFTTGIPCSSFLFTLKTTALAIDIRGTGEFPMRRFT